MMLSLYKLMLLGILFLSGCGGSTTKSNPSPGGVNITAQEIKSYAKIVLAIEPIRLAAYQDIQKVSGSVIVPSIGCNQSQERSMLGQDLQKIMANFCEQAKKISSSNGLSVTDFNRLSGELRVNQNLMKQIQAELIRLQTNR